MEKRTIMYLLITLETKRHSLKLSGSELKGNGRTMQNQTGWEGATELRYPEPQRTAPHSKLHLVKQKLKEKPLYSVAYFGLERVSKSPGPSPAQRRTKCDVKLHFYVIKYNENVRVVLVYMCMDYFWSFPNFWVLELLTMLLECTGIFPGTRLAEAVGYFAVQELQLVLAIINPTCNYF